MALFVVRAGILSGFRAFLTPDGAISAETGCSLDFSNEAYSDSTYDCEPGFVPAPPSAGQEQKQIFTS
ncbi:MAG TPA: hypothetical protein DC013_09375 [Ruminococcaceae bacterium]|jgi:hypothetical protein|nr:hypothetical protein [Oscillospiraceae bacterium]